MDRRTYLHSVGVAGIATVAGCLDAVPGLGGSATALDTPSQPRGDPSHPIHGEEMPSFSLPDPLTGEEISSADLEGESSYLLTFFFTSCPDGACPALLLRLRRAQEDALERGYDDDLTLLAMTFDPERDTADVLREYGEQQGADLEAGNWHFLRPDSYEEGKELLDETFGIPIKKTDEHPVDDSDDGGNDDDGDHDTGDHDDTDDDHDHGEYTFIHSNIILLVNEDGIVERSYPTLEQSETTQLVADVRTVVGE